MNIRDRIRSRVFGIFSIFAMELLLLMGCSATPTPKPEVATVQPQQQTAASKPGKAAVSSPASSLEAHIEGKSPASGPLKDIYFDFDQYDLGTDARDILKTNAEWLKDKTAAQVQIEGHCDERGTGEYNLALGAKRAQVAKDYLATLGVSAGRITTISYGKELPVCTEHTEDCWERNRHDRFVVHNVPTA